MKKYSLKMNTDEYFALLENKINECYEIAERARSKNLDPESYVEIAKSKNLAERVEALVGPKGVAKEIESGKNIRKIIDEILDGNFELKNKTIRERAEQAIRTGLAIETEGVVAAPIEGISKVTIEKNLDNTEYLSIFFAGPIRSAGGTAQGFAVLLGCYIQSKLRLPGYRPLQDEIERYAHEVILYDRKCKPLQYCPTEDEIKTIIKNIPICIDGDPTESVEVMNYRNLKRVPTNRIRGGVCLVIGEGLALKAKKLAKKAKEFDIDWNFLLNLGKKEVKKIEEDEKKEEYAKFMSEIVGGRPIFSFSNRSGGFRLRYGRSRASGIAAKNIHPATMEILDEFPSQGTQFKIDRPGKGAVVISCENIKGPVVKLNDGSVVEIESIEKAKELKNSIKEILFLGDILVSYGDFLQTNTPLLPSGYVEEWYKKDLENKGIFKSIDEINSMNIEEAIKISQNYDIPLHPKYTYFWEELNVEEVMQLRKFLSRGDIKDNKFYVPYKEDKEKRLLEILCVEHKISKNFIVIENYVPLLYTLNLLCFKDGKFVKNFIEITEEKYKEYAKKYNEIKKHEFPEVNIISPVKIRTKAGCYIGTRMGRPEKAKERKMQPPVHSLYPVGKKGGKERLLNEAAKEGIISVEIGNGKSIPSKREINIKEEFEKAVENLKLTLGKENEIYANGIEKKIFVKAVEGLISEEKIPERIEKGILRAKHDVFVFKDGTIRYDATDIPITHFKPKEANVSIEKLRELGYDKDYKGNELKDDNQILELKCQDVLIPQSSVKYLINIANFIDDLLIHFYHQEPYYNIRNQEDLIGNLIIGLAPHTSAGIIGRIIGFTNARGCFAHPYWHAAKRRNCDGDEDAIMLLMDALLNFSKKFLPSSKGGKMDTPLVLTTILNPKEVDDEVHKMEVVNEYPLEFYEATLKNSNPGDIKIKIVKDILDSNPYENLNFTHDNGNLNNTTTETKYVQLKEMSDKVNAQLRLAEKIRAVDVKTIAEILINSHFLRDIQGNLRAFSEQAFRCTTCNKIYRRIPLPGKCECGGNLVLTISEGGIKKYLDLSLNIAEKYEIDTYIKQRIEILKNNVNSMFEKSKSQRNLADFF